MHIREKVVESLTCYRNGKLILSGIKITKIDNQLKSDIVLCTSFMDFSNPTLNDRINYIFNEIPKVNICPSCGNPMLRVAAKFCSYDCSNQNLEKRMAYSEHYNSLSEQSKRDRIIKRNSTVSDKYGNGSLEAANRLLHDAHIKTIKSKYGVDNISQIQSVKDKKTESSFFKYGTDNVLQSEIIKDKIKVTLLEKYGVLCSLDIDIPNRISKALKTKIESGLCIDPKFLSEWKVYSRNVRRLTNITYDQFKSVINPNNLKRSVNITELDTYQLDHKYSVFDGFLNNIPVDIISHVCNLELISGKENNKKRTNSSIIIENLIELIKTFENDK